MQVVLLILYRVLHYLAFKWNKNYTQMHDLYNILSPSHRSTIVQFRCGTATIKFETSSRKWGTCVHVHKAVFTVLAIVNGEQLQNGGLYTDVYLISNVEWLDPVSIEKNSVWACDKNNLFTILLLRKYITLKSLNSLYSLVSMICALPLHLQLFSYSESIVQQSHKTLATVFVKLIAGSSKVSVSVP